MEPLAPLDYLFGWIKNQNDGKPSKPVKPKPSLAWHPTKADIHKGEIELKKNLTAPDLLMVACSQEYLEQNDDLLCREMFCRLQTREGDGAAQSECEEIANVSNSITVLNSCKNLGIELETCVDYIGKRK